MVCKDLQDDNPSAQRQEFKNVVKEKFKRTYRQNNRYEIVDSNCPTSLQSIM